MEIISPTVINRIVEIAQKYVEYGVTWDYCMQKFVETLRFYELFCSEISIAYVLDDLDTTLGMEFICKNEGRMSTHQVVKQQSIRVSNPELYEYSIGALDHCDSIISKTIEKLSNTVRQLDQENSISTTEAIKIISKYNELIREVSAARMYILADCKYNVRDRAFLEN